MTVRDALLFGPWGRRVLVAGGAASALVPALAMWGFTVDDALIAVRYARHIADGAGYRFDAAGPSTDGVTPLPWAPLVAGLSLVTTVREPLALLHLVKGVSVAVWTASIALLAWRASESPGRGRVALAVALVVLSLAFGHGAWAASGMETGLATALATCAALSVRRPLRAAALAGLASTLRPELVVWAASLALFAAIAEGRGARRWATSLAIAAAPFLACVVVRVACFGRPAPLAVLAKPSDLSHGLVYAGAATAFVLLPLLALAPRAVARAGGAARVLALAFLAHVVAVVSVGGDWMPYARLLVPVAPSLVLVYVESAREARVWSLAARAVAALVLGIVFVARTAPRGRRVQQDRDALVARARPLLEGARVVAALDVGWVGAATEACVVDLAGLTDPTIAALPGGHTSKRVDATMLIDREVDVLVVYGEPRVVERRLLESELFEARFAPAERLPLGESSYVLYRRRSP